MATYQELRERFSSDGLRAVLEVAICVKAHAILQESTSPAERKAWAVAAFAPATTFSEADRLLRYLLAEYKDLTTAQIDGVAVGDPVVLQGIVDQAIDKIHPAS